MRDGLPEGTDVPYQFRGWIGFSGENTGIHRARVLDGIKCAGLKVLNSFDDFRQVLPLDHSEQEIDIAFSSLRVQLGDPESLFTKRGRQFF